MDVCTRSFLDIRDPRPTVESFRTGGHARRERRYCRTLPVPVVDVVPISLTNFEICRKLALKITISYSVVHRCELRTVAR
jgi:hypothetical protein